MLLSEREPNILYCIFISLCCQQLIIEAMDNTICKICGNIADGDNAQTLTEAGVKSMNNIQQSFENKLEFSINNRVHKRCRLKYFNKSRYATAAASSSKEKPPARPPRTGFDYKTDCLFCKEQVAKHVTDAEVYNNM